MHATRADSAELVAKLAGTRGQRKTTHQLDERGIAGALGQSATGPGPAREVEEFVIHPNTIKQLPTGRAVVIGKEPRYRWHVVEVVAR